MVKRLAAVAVAVLFAGSIGYGAVVKTTTTNPTSWGYGVGASAIGVAFGFRGPAGPGVVAGTTAGALSILSGSLSKSEQASVKVAWDNSTPGTFYRFVTAVVVGISYSYAKSFSVWFISGGTMTSKNTLEYTTAVDEDGVVQVVLSGQSQSTAVGTGGNSGSQFTPLFKFYGGLVEATSHAHVQSNVKSTSQINATPLSVGVANGQVATWVIGLP